MRLREIVENEIALCLSPGGGFNSVASCGQVSAIFTIVK